MPFSLPARSLGVLAITTASLLASSALAAQYNPDSRIDAVTVFPSGAEIERIASVQLSDGSHEIVFDNLPDGIRADDVRVEGVSAGELLIGSVDVARVPVTGDPALRNALEAERESLTDRKSEIEGRIRTAELQRDMIREMVQMPAAQPDQPAAAPPMPPEALFTFIAERHGQIEATILEARKDIRDIERRIAEIDRELSRQNGTGDWATRVIVNVDAAGAGGSELKLRYRHARASWQPVYDARLDTQAKSGGLTITQRAAVNQRTGEDWSGVRMALATTRPSGMTAAPEADVRYVGFARPERKERRVGGSFMQDGDAAMMAPAPAAEPPQPTVQREAEEQRAQVTDLGFDAMYAVPGLVAVPSTDDAKLLQVGTWESDANMEARIVPARFEAAFLTVRFIHEGDAPLPEGQVRLFRDGIFIGQGQMPLAMTGDETELGFGRDERITVERQLVSKRQGEEGIFSKAKTDVTDWRTAITNHHSVPVDVVVLESLPQPLDERITVAALSTNDKPDETDVDDKPGVMAWRFALEPGAERRLAFGFRIDWPDGERILLGRR
ncbi:mucoidy inhibitor MuiA family protein [Tepidamorphus sp. 3E244]|uniref:mucoidy inhibitor MuiA family protein n=1 Tax=Tepidamorphus sp. 3E244 TaxID=3385498 RepID=UPI0038FBEC12